MEIKPTHTEHVRYKMDFEGNLRNPLYLGPIYTAAKEAGLDLDKDVFMILGARGRKASFLFSGRFDVGELTRAVQEHSPGTLKHGEFLDASQTRAYQ